MVGLLNYQRFEMLEASLAVISVKTDVGARLDELMAFVDRKVAKVGWFEKSKYPDEPGQKGLPVAEVALTQEMGSPVHHIPARPFLRPTVRDRQTIWFETIEKFAKQALAGKVEPFAMYEGVGLQASGDIRKAISLVFTPKLADVTIQRRLERRANKVHIGSLTKPLIDTGLMFNSLTNVVEDG